MTNVSVQPVIRQVLQAGDLALAAKLLGRPIASQVGCNMVIKLVVPLIFQPLMCV